MISAVVNTCNEEKYIGRCLEHLKWADEIVIVDMYSSDRTVEIARKFTDKIYFHKRTISVLYARNFSLTKASGDWILVVDPDEVIPESLAQEILKLINSNPDFVAIAFPSKSLYFGRWLKYAYPLQWQTRCFKKGHVSYPARVHSQPQIAGGRIYALPGDEKYQINHYEFDTVSQFLGKANRYTSDEAYHMHHDDGIKFRNPDLIKKPIAEFKNRFLLRKGYKDGIAGFIFCVLMTIYRFLTWAKLWEIQKGKKPLRESK